MTETVDTRTEVEEKQAEAVALGGWGPSTRRREVQRQAAALLSKESLAKSFSEDMCGGAGAVAKDSYSIFKFEPLHNLHLWVSRLLEL